MTKPDYAAQTITAKLATGETVYFIASTSTAGTYYKVEHVAGHLTCTCPARKPCKHIKYIAAKITQALKDERAVAMPDDAKWALIEQILPERAAAAHLAATEACATMEANDSAIDAPLSFDEPEPDLVAILAEPDLPRSALYFDDDEPTIEQRREVALNRIEREEAIVEFRDQRQAEAARERAAKREAELDQAERNAKREAAIIADHCPETFSIFRS